MPLSQLHDGIDVPVFVTRIPWLITRSDLYDFIPKMFFTTSPGGWPMLPFTLLGLTRTFSFNFAWHPESKLLGVEFSDPDDETIEDAFRIAAALLRKHLGEPNAVNRPERHQMWRDDRVWVDHLAYAPEAPGAPRLHRLSVYYHAGKPRDWVSSAERTLIQVKRLFKSMPGVEVIEVWTSPGQTVFGLAVHSRRSLAWLAHLADWANVKVALRYDGYREANGGLKPDDPSSVLYRVEVAGPREPEPGGDSTTLQIVGIYLVDYLRERGLLERDEAHRLSMAFNNHDE